MAFNSEPKRCQSLQRKGDNLREFQLEVQYPSSPERVWAMLTNPDFLKFRFRQIPAFLGQVQVEKADSGIYISRATLKPHAWQELGKYAHLLPEELAIEIVETWVENPAVPLIAEGSFQVNIASIPVTIKADSQLKHSESNGQETVRNLSGTLEVKLPFIGGKIEREILSRMQLLASEEEDAAASWLQGGAQ